jgi:4-hydroxythreonine-4-phosphate dehydrogenase
MHLADFPYIGHTDFLGATYEGSKPLMMMVDDNFRVALVTAHVPIVEVGNVITKERVEETLNKLILTLQQDFGIEKPHIAVLGLNPHAGDEGTIGEEEDHILRPVIEEFKNNGHIVSGPFGADGFFGARLHNKVDAVLAMFHDQGLIPFKSVAFHSGVNFSAGLPVIRTSPDHGTAFEIAGKNVADPQSMRNAIYLAIDTHRKRAEYLSDRSNVMQRTEKETEKG